MEHLPQPQLMDYTELVRWAQQGDAGAFEELLRRYRRVVLATARAYVGPGEAEDVAQEVFVRAWAKISQVRAPAAFPGWLKALAVNVCRQWQINNSRAGVPLQLDDVVIVSTEEDPLRHILREARSLEVQEALLAIPKGNRDALIMHQWAYRPYAEIAEIQGVSVAVVASRIHRAKNQLRQILGVPAFGGGKVVKQARAGRTPVSNAILIPQLGHGAGVSDIVSGPGGRRFATTDNAGWLVVWNVQTRQQEMRVRGATSYAHVSFSADDGRLAVPMLSEHVAIYDLEQGEEVLSLPVNASALRLCEDYLWTASWTPDAEGGSWAKTNLLCWDLRSRQVVKRFENLPGSPVKISQNADRALTMAGDPVMERRALLSMSNVHLLVWDLSTGELVSTLEGLSGFGRVNQISADGSLVAASSWDRNTPRDVLLWDASSGCLLHTLSGHTDTVGAIAFSPDESVVAAVSLDGRIICWDTATGEKLQEINIGYRMDALSFTADGEWLAACTGVWEWRTGVPITIFQRTTNWFETAALAGDGRKLVMSGLPAGVLVWDCFDSRLGVLPIEGYSHITSLACGPSGADAVASTVRYAGEEIYSKLFHWDLEQMVLKNESREYQGKIHQVALDHTGERLAVVWGTRGRVDTGVRIVMSDVATQEVVREFVHPQEGWLIGEGLVFSPDDKSIACICTKESVNGIIQRGEVRLWDVATGETVSVCEDNRGMNGFCFSPDGSKMAVGLASAPTQDEDPFCIRLVDVDTRELLQEMVVPKPVWQAHRIIFSPDGSLIAATSVLGELTLWEAASGKLLRVLHRHSGWAAALMFHHTGQMLLEVSVDGLVLVWRVSDLINEADPVHRVTFVPINNGSDWIAYTPDGDYDCSPGGESYLLWREGDRFVSAEEMRGRHRPGLFTTMIEQSEQF